MPLPSSCGRTVVQIYPFVWVRIPCGNGDDACARLYAVAGLNVIEGPCRATRAPSSSAADDFDTAPKIMRAVHFADRGRAELGPIFWGVPPPAKVSRLGLP